jgi:hypothetical protein
MSTLNTHLAPPDIRELLDPDERERRLVQAEASIMAGKGIAYDAVRTWLLELAAGHRMPPPTCG